MPPVGFLHDKMDVKILILFILNRIETPLRQEDIYEVAYQDDSLNYFVFVESIQELTQSGHMEQGQDGRYTITEKGRKQGTVVEDSLAIPVVQKVSVAIQKKIDQLHRESLLTTAVEQDENGKWIVTLRYRDGDMPLMSLSLMAPDQTVGEAMGANLKRHIKELYKTSMDCATDTGKKRGDRT